MIDHWLKGTSTDRSTNSVHIVNPLCCVQGAPCFWTSTWSPSCRGTRPCSAAHRCSSPSPVDTFRDGQSYPAPPPRNKVYIAPSLQVTKKHRWSLFNKIDNVIFFASLVGFDWKPLQFVFHLFIFRTFPVLTSGSVKGIKMETNKKTSYKRIFFTLKVYVYQV